MRYLDYLQTPIGIIEIQASSVGVSKVIFPETHEKKTEPNEYTDACKQQLGEYLDNKRTKFDLPLDLLGTQFQKSVWSILCQIPFGQAIAYRDIARQMNNLKAVRAVGAANGKNPVSIIVPCHRVIGSNGTLTGYAGGLDRKAWLLTHENVEFKQQTAINFNSEDTL